MDEFPKFPKIPRWWKTFTITEKIDGTNGLIYVRDREIPDTSNFAETDYEWGDFAIKVGSRNRWISPGSDNYGMAQWVRDHAEDACRLGPGFHYGEWYGSGINRGYNLANGEKRFALFNSHRWGSMEIGDRSGPPGFDVVPVIWYGSGDDVSDGVRRSLDFLKLEGSFIAPGFDRPEGIIVYSNENRAMWKKYLINDRNPKDQ